jgi:hypothetical protein
MGLAVRPYLDGDGLNRCPEHPLVHPGIHENVRRGRGWPGKPEAESGYIKDVMLDYPP